MHSFCKFLLLLNGRQKLVDTLLGCLDALSAEYEADISYCDECRSVHHHEAAADHPETSQPHRYPADR
jgi:hypothetical protein